MPVQGLTEARNLSNVILSSSGLMATCSGSVNGHAKLSNANQSYDYYQSLANALFGFDVDFIVWGEPAAFTLTGTISSPVYNVRLRGPSAAINCTGGSTFQPNGGDGDTECTSVNESGLLEPGEYHLDLDISMVATIVNECGEPPSPFCATSGTVTFNGSLDGFELSVSQAPLAVVAAQP